MRQTAKWLACATALTTFGVVDGQEKPVPPPAPKPAPKVAVRQVPLKVAAVAADDAMVAQWEQHFGPQFRQVFRSEMHFMRLVCEPTKAQYEAIAANNEAMIKSAIRKYCEGMRGGQGNQSDPRAAFTAGIAKAVRATLAADRANRYDKELELRTAARKRTAVVNLVATIDKLLILSADQRESLAEVLTANWDETWGQTQMLMYGAQYLPQMPDAKITPLLSPPQVKIWQGIAKTNVRFGGVAFMQGMEVEDEVWDEKPAPKAVEKK